MLTYFFSFWGDFVHSPFDIVAVFGDNVGVSATMSRLLATMSRVSATMSLFLATLSLVWTGLYATFLLLFDENIIFVCFGYCESVTFCK